MKKNAFHLALIVLLYCLGMIPGVAAKFDVSPVRINLSPRRPTAAMEVTNLANSPVTVQAHVVAWDVKHGSVVYSDSDDILLNPPIFTLRPHEAQYMRLGLRFPNESPEEVDYRLILEQVPQPPKPGFSGLQTILRISIPIFSVPLKPIEPQITWRAVRAGNGSMCVIAANRGSAHIQIKELTINTSSANHPAFRTTNLSYLLPGQSETWTVSKQRKAGMAVIRIEAITDAGEIHEALALKRP